MINDKKDDILRARVDDKLKKRVAKYGRARGWTEAQIIREAIMEFLKNAAA